jgi:hypothetical protein
MKKSRELKGEDFLIEHELDSVNYKRIGSKSAMVSFTFSATPV